jgi:hypothetical protein
LCKGKTVGQKHDSSGNQASRVGGNNDQHGDLSALLMESAEKA